MDTMPPDYRLALKQVELAIMQNMVNPMYALQGKQRAKEGIRSERFSVMGNIALQDLGRAERRQNYTGFRIAKRLKLYEQGRCEYR
ncbi:MAG: hypothetical protein LBM77_02105 [Spirochaetaceae bacterium]|jgi:hypothetical protein|nr:hypothetical protein [Spirochaetaceae bacterium]